MTPAPQATAEPPRIPTPRGFAERLLGWWDRFGRKAMPWQRHRTPYRVWVSEVMLQQTQAATVARYFDRFMARFPDVSALAQANLDEVLHVWSGLGYYRRARQLHRSAQLVLGEHKGVLPDSLQGLMALPGIGRSTAAAVVAQAHGRRAVILDGNVKRVLARHHRVAGPVSATATLRELWRLADEHTPAQRVAEYTQAIMDLGATICRPATPKCGICPLCASCAGRAAGDATAFPQARPKARQRRLERKRFFVLTDSAGACHVERRPASGVWAGLWSPPERNADESVQRFLSRRGISMEDVRTVQFAKAFRHRFSHYDLDVQPVYVRLRRRPAEVREGASGQWIEPGNHRLGLSAVAAKLLRTATTLGSSTMSRTVLCRKYGEELPGLAAPPLPGAAGEDIFDNVSAKAWQEWQHLQTMLINERHLSMVERSARQYLGEQMAKFLANEDYDKPSGYTPPEPSAANDQQGTE